MEKKTQELNFHHISVSCAGETCSLCGSQATHKAEETIAHDDPNRNRHPFTAYLCCFHFKKIFGTTVTCEATSPGDTEETIFKSPVIDLTRWLAKYVIDLHKLRSEILATKDFDKLALEFPVLQGIENQRALEKIGNQKLNTANLAKAIQFLINHEENTE